MRSRASRFRSACCSGCWRWIVKFRGEPLIAWSPRQPVPWTVFDLLLLLLAGLVIATATQLLLAWYADLPMESLRLSDPELTSRQRVDLLVGVFACLRRDVDCESVVAAAFRGGITDGLGMARHPGART